MAVAGCPFTAGSFLYKSYRHKGYLSCRWGNAGHIFLSADALYPAWSINPIYPLLHYVRFSEPTEKGRKHLCAAAPSLLCVHIPDGAPENKRTIPACFRLLSGGRYVFAEDGIGANGSGKSVFFKTICDFLKADGGTIALDDKVLGKDMDFLPELGILF